MRTCTAPILIKSLAMADGRLTHKPSSLQRSSPLVRRSSLKAMVLIEMIVIVALLGLLTGIAMVSFEAMFGDTRFKSRAEELANAFQMAYDAAVQTDRRYAVVLDRLADTWTLRQFETLDFSVLSEDEAIISVGVFDHDFQFDYVLYDDFEDTRDRGEAFTEARFYAGRAGWQFGGKVVIRDADGRPWSILIHRLGRPVELVEGDVGFLVPQRRDQVPF